VRIMLKRVLQEQGVNLVTVSGCSGAFCIRSDEPVGFMKTGTFLVTWVGMTTEFEAGFCTV
jgi:hypothetical protein